MRSMNHRLQGKLATAVLSIVIICTLVSTIYSLREVKQVVKERTDAYGVFLSKTLATFCAEDILAWDYPSLQLSVDHIVEYDPHILMIDIYHSDKIVANYKINSKEKGLEYYAPISMDVLGKNQEFGRVKIIISDKKFHAFYVQQIYALLTLGLILGFGDTFLIYMAMKKMVLEPIKSIEEGAKIIGDGKFNHRINIKRQDEIGVLAQTLNMMAENLKLSKNETEDYKKHLENKIHELETFHNLTVGRELKMIDLKKRIKELENSGRTKNKKIKNSKNINKKNFNCWNFWNCDKKTREKCPAYTTKSGEECWMVATEYCPLLKKEFKTCAECTWFKKANQKNKEI